MVCFQQKVTSFPMLQPQETHMMSTWSILDFLKYCDSMLPWIKHFFGVCSFFHSDGTIKFKMPSASGNLIVIANLVRPPSFFMHHCKKGHSWLENEDSNTWCEKIYVLNFTACNFKWDTGCHRYPRSYVFLPNIWMATSPPIRVANKN